MIAIDGKNGATGSIQLSWRQYQQLYRVYLQTYNGDASPLIPDSIYASPDNGTTRVAPVRVSLGVYEFDLMVGSATHFVTITGPAGIVWNPNNFALNETFFARLAPEDGTNGVPGTQNFVSYAQNQTPRYVYGYIKNITRAEASSLSVKIGSSRGPNPLPPVDCERPEATIVNNVPYATYQCLTQPQTLHDLIPSRPGKVFNIEVKSFDKPLDDDEFGSAQNPYFIASDAPTYDINGRVAAGGAGTVVDLFYTPNGSSQSIGLRAITDGTGSFRFSNLPPRFYTLRAQRSGFVFNDPGPVSLTTDTNVVITVQNSCRYTAGDMPMVAPEGGEAQFTIKASDPTCEWSASSSTKWISIQSGATVGNGPVFFKAEPNSDPARNGVITVGDQEFSITQASLSTVSVTVQTSPARLLFSVDGIGSRATQKFTWNSGSAHEISTLSPQTDANGDKYEFAGWSDEGSRDHTVSPTGDTVYTARFTQIRAAGQPRTPLDFDGDGKADIAVFRPSNNLWFLQGSALGFAIFEFGVNGDKLSPADYDGDGKTDIAVFRPSNGTWYVAGSATGFSVQEWGAPGDLPVPADYNGDGRADLAVFRPSNSTWYIKYSSDGAISITPFGAAGDQPQIGDFDGDGRADFAVFRPSQNFWYLLRTTGGFTGIVWGSSGDIRVPADYDGDGKTDLAVFRPSTGTWFIFAASGSISVQNWGVNGDTPVPADYDGDGKADLAVFRQSNRTWYVFSTSAGINIVPFGADGDVPIPSVFSY